MKNKIMLVLVSLFIMLGFSSSALAVNVDWGTIYYYTSVGYGTEGVAQFSLTFKEGSNTYNTYGFCVTPTVNIYKGDYNHKFLDWTKDYLQAAWLMDNYAPTATTLTGNGDNTIGIQSAIWSAVTNDTGYAPTIAGSIEYNKYYGSLDFATLNENYLKQNYKILDNYISGKTNLYQTLIIKYPSTVPVPAAVWMLGSGLIGLCGLRARRRS